MENIKLGNMEISVPNLLLMIGGLLMIICTFLTWVKIGEYVLLVGWEWDNASGMDLISNKLAGQSVSSYSFIGKIPLIMLIAGIVALVLGALPMFNIDNDVIKIVGAVVALLAVIFGLLFLIQGHGVDLFTGDAKTFMKGLIDAGWGKIELQFGSILAFIAALVACVGGVMNVLPIFKK